MKKLFSWLLVATMIVSIALPVSAATVYSKEEMIADNIMECQQEFETNLEFSNGKTLVCDGVPNLEAVTSAMEDNILSEYKISENDEQLLEVEYHENESLTDTPLVNGYYCVRITISVRRNTQMFLTGLTEAQLESVQLKVISSYKVGSSFNVSSLDFIDAEKTKAADDDDNLCWAAAASNALWYTGWAQRASGRKDLGGNQITFSNEDDVLQYFVDSFTNDGSSQNLAYKWFFNGSYAAQNISSYAKVKKIGKSGGLLVDYNIMDLSYYTETVNSISTISSYVDLLEQGYGVTVGTKWIDKGEYLGGHAQTLMGYICDLDFDKSSEYYYTDLIMADSDSYNGQTDKDDRTSGEDRYTSVPVSACSFGGGKTLSYREMDYYGVGSSTCLGVIGVLSALAPYSSDIPYEQDPNASYDYINGYDVGISDVFINREANNGLTTNTCFYKNIPLYAHIVVNTIGKTTTIDLPYVVKILDSRGNVIRNSGVITEKGFIAGIDGTKSVLDCYYYIGNLEPGEYTVKVDLNPSKTLKEALYLNNTYEFTLNILDEEEPQVCECTVNIGAFIDDKAKISLSYSDTSYFQNDVWEIVLYASYFNDGEWGPYEMLSYGYSFPKSSTIRNGGQKVKFLVEASMALGKADIDLYTKEYYIKNSVLSVNADETNTEKTSVLEDGAKELKSGEQFAFTVSNVSGINQSVDYDAFVYAIKGDGKTEIAKFENQTIAAGKESKVYSVNSWTKTLTGTYTIQVVVKSKNGDEYSLNLGNLNIREKKSAVVTSAQDSNDPFDGVVSLREAVTYAQQLNTEVTVISVLNEIVLNSNLIIQKDVVINGIRKNQQQGICLTGNGNIVVDGNCAVTLKNIYFLDMNDSSVVVKTGSLVCDNCVFSNITSKANGGAIRVESGKAIFKSVTFDNCDAIKGMVANVSFLGGADFLNCNFITDGNTVSAIINSGTVNIINSTFCGVENIAENTMQGKTNLVGCIIAPIAEVKEGTTYYGCLEGNIEDVFVIDEETGKACWSSDEGTLKYIPHLHSIISDGIGVNVKDNKIVYTEKGQEKETDIDSVFTVEELSKDMCGNARYTLYGSYAISVDGLIRGDVNGDNNITSEDALLALQCSVGKISLEPKYSKAADVNNNSKVDTDDVLRILQFIVKKRTEL